MEHLRISIHDLESSPYSISIGSIGDIFLEAYKTDNTIVFSHNLGGSKKPTKQEVTALLSAMEQGFNDLCTDHPEFADYMKNKKFNAEIIVFSGQMDFHVATLSEGSVRWFVDLD